MSEFRKVSLPKGRTEMKSTHKAFVEPIILKEHPNADSLSLVTIKEVWNVVVRTEDWQGVDRGVFIQPDTLVPDTDHFSFHFKKTYRLKSDKNTRVAARTIEEALELLTEQGITVTEKDLETVLSNSRYTMMPDGTSIKREDGAYARVTVKKFRGIKSFGLLVPAPEGAEIGDNLAEELGLQHYEAAISAVGGESERGPSGVTAPKYDVDALKNNIKAFEEGELVSISEKIHGTNARFFYGKDSDEVERMFCSSHYHWKKDSPASVWWRALRAHPEVEQFCKENPDVVVYGEVYGNPVQGSYDYGLDDAAVGIFVFDLFRLPKEGEPQGHWIDVKEARAIGKDLPWVPLIAHDVPFDMEKILEMAEGKSTVSGVRKGHIREGVVVRPMKERSITELGRVCLKVVGFGYYEKKHKKRNK